MRHSCTSIAAARAAENASRGELVHLDRSRGALSVRSRRRALASERFRRAMRDGLGVGEAAAAAAAATDAAAQAP